MSGMPTQPKDFVSSKDQIVLLIINRKKPIGVKEKGLKE
jgi:hypothetical protein